MISVRWLADQLNYKVDWDSEKQVAYISNDATELYFKSEDSKIITQNGTIEMEGCLFQYVF